MRKPKHWSYYESTKDLALTGEPRGVFSVFTGEKIPRRFVVWYQFVYIVCWIFYLLSPIRRKAITWSNAGLLLIGHLGINSCSEIRIGILSFPFKKMHSKLSAAKMASILSRGRWVATLIINLTQYINLYHWCTRVFKSRIYTAGVPFINTD